MKKEDKKHFRLFWSHISKGWFCFELPMSFEMKRVGLAMDFPLINQCKFIE